MIEACIKIVSFDELLRVSKHFMIWNDFFSFHVFIKIGCIFMQNAQHFEANTALCKVSTKNDSYIVRYGLFICVSVYLYASPTCFFLGDLWTIW